MGCVYSLERKAPRRNSIDLYSGPYKAHPEFKIEEDKQINMVNYRIEPIKKAVPRPPPELPKGILF